MNRYHDTKAIEKQNKNWATRSKKKQSKINRNHPWQMQDRQAFGKRERSEDYKSK